MERNIREAVALLTATLNRPDLSVDMGLLCAKKLEYAYRLLGQISQQANAATMQAVALQRTADKDVDLDGIIHFDSEGGFSVEKE
jgi:hypothetical protein